MEPMVPGSNPAKYPFFFLSLSLFLYFFFFFFFFFFFSFLLCFVVVFSNTYLNNSYLIKCNLIQTNSVQTSSSVYLNFGVNYSCSFYTFLFYCNIFYKTKTVATCSHRLPFIFLALVLSKHCRVCFED